MLVLKHEDPKMLSYDAPTRLINGVSRVRYVSDTTNTGTILVGHTMSNLKNIFLFLT